MLTTGTTDQLKPEDLGIVLRELTDVSTKWYYLGLLLVKNPYTLDMIKMQNPLNIKAQHCEMLKAWLKMVNPRPTWRVLTKALRSSIVREQGLARYLEEKYYGKHSMLQIFNFFLFKWGM